MAIDQRFYETRSEPTIEQLASRLELVPVGGDVTVKLHGFAASRDASEGELTFLSTPDIGALEECQASACFVPPDLVTRAPDDVRRRIALLGASDPRGAFGVAAGSMAQRRELHSGEDHHHHTAKIDPSAILYPGTVLGAGVSIGAGSRIGANTVIGPGVQIGRNCTIGSNATIFCALIGNEVGIFTGAVIGENGFGLAHQDGRLIPHFGRVILQDGASIGVNSSVDRGMLGDTVIGAGANIDNLCHIGHNVEIGPGVVMAAFAGVSGSSRVGANAQFGGRVGLSDHVTVGPGARIAAGAAVLEDVPAGETWAGYPAKPIRRWFRELAWLSKAAHKRTQ